MISAHATRRRPVAGSVIYPEPSEVGFCQLTRRRVRHPHRTDTAPSPVALHDEATQRRVRHRAAPRCQQLLDAGNRQTVASEPLVDLVRPRAQTVLNRRLHPPRPSLADPRQTAQLLLLGSRTILHYPGRFAAARACPCAGRGIPYRRSRQPRPFRYLPLTASSLPASYHFLYFHSEHLLVRHLCTSIPKCRNGRPCGAPWWSKTLAKWSIVRGDFADYWYIVLGVLHGAQPMHGVQVLLDGAERQPGLLSRRATIRLTRLTLSRCLPMTTPSSCAGGTQQRRQRGQVRAI